MFGNTASRHVVQQPEEVTRARTAKAFTNYVILCIFFLEIMSDFRSYSHKFITEFIDCFRSYPCLWKIKDVYYKDKYKKLEGYNKLLELLRKVEPDGTIDSVKKKINSLRAGFRKENRKVRESMTVSGDEQVYVPKLWYYNQLLFLTDQHEDSNDYFAFEIEEQDTETPGKRVCSEPRFISYCDSEVQQSSKKEESSSEKLTEEKLLIAKIQRKIAMEELEQKILQRKLLEKELEHKEIMNELEKKHLLLKIEILKKDIEET